MSKNNVVANGLRSEEIISDLSRLVQTGKAKAYRVHGIHTGQIELQIVERIDLINPHFIKPKSGARYFFEHNTWKGANGSSGSNSALFLVGESFDPSNSEHYELKGVRFRVAGKHYVAELTLYAEDNKEHRTVLHGEHDPARDGLIDYFLRRVRG
jgi:hypothetical protein